MKKIVLFLFLALVFMAQQAKCVSMYDKKCSGGLCGISDRTNQIIVPFQYEDIILPQDIYKNELPPQLIVKKEGKYGVIDSFSEKELLPFEYDEIVPIEFSKWKYIVKKGNKYSFIQVKSSEIINILTDYDLLSYQSPVIVAKKDGKMFLIGCKKFQRDVRFSGELIESDKFDDINIEPFWGNIFLVKNNNTNKYNLLKVIRDNVQPAEVADYKLLLTKEYDNIRFLKHKFYELTEGKKMLLAKIDEDSVELKQQDANFKDIVAYDNYSIKYFIFEKDGKLGLLDNNFETVLPYEYNSIEIDAKNYPIAKIDGKYKFMQAKDETFEDLYKISTKKYGSYSFIKTNKGKERIKKYSTQKLAKKLNYSKGYYATGYIGKKDGKYGAFFYKKSDYEQLIPFEFDKVAANPKAKTKDEKIQDKINSQKPKNSEVRFVNSKGAIYKINNKYGYIDKSANILLDSKYDYIYNPKLNSKYLFVREDGNYAIYNTLTQKMSDFKYADIKVDPYGIIKVSDKSVYPVKGAGNYLKNKVFASFARKVLPDKYALRFVKGKDNEIIGEDDFGGGGF